MTHSGPTAPLSPDELQRIKQIATYQRIINVAILANIIGYVTYNFMPEALQVVAWLVLVVVGIASSIACVMLAKTLHGIGVAVACAVLSFVPCVGLLTLLVLNQQATTAIRKAGFKVGILGGNPADIK